MTRQMVGGGVGRDSVQLRPIPPGGQSIDRRIITVAEVFLKEQGIQSHFGLPSLGVLRHEDEPLEYFTLRKTNKAYFWEHQWTVGDRVHP